MAKKKSTIHGKRPKRPPGPMERKFLEDLGAGIKERRTELGTTADALAREIGITITPQFDRESGKVSMPAEDLLRYARALACLPSDLVKDAEQAIEPSQSPTVRRAKKPPTT